MFFNRIKSARAALHKDLNLEFMTLKFKDGLERNFNFEHFTRSQLKIRISFYTAIIIFSTFTIVDVLYLSESLESLLFIRHVLGNGIFIIAFFILKSRFYRKYWQVILSLMVLWESIVVLLLIMYSPKPAGYMYYVGLIVILFFLYTALNVKFLYALITGVIIFLSYAGYAKFSAMPSATTAISTMFLLIVTMIGLVVNYLLEISSRRDFYFRNQLLKARVELEKMNIDLESIVAKRTSELKNKNTELENEISMRKLSEEKLSRSEKNYKHIFNGAMHIIFTIDRDYKFVLVNESIAEIVKLPSSEISGMPIEKIFTNATTDKLISYIDKTFNEKTSFCTDFSIPFQDEKKWFHSTFQLIEDYETGEELILVIGNDISEAKISQEQILKQQTILSSIIDNLPVGVFAKDAKRDYKFIIWNRKLEEIFANYSREMLGTSDYDFFDTREADYYRQTDVNVMQGKKVIDIPLEEVSTRRGLIKAHTIKVPIYDSNGEPEILLGILEDITEMIYSENKLKESEFRFRQLADTIQDVFWLWEDDKMLYMSPAYEQVWGLSIQQVYDNPQSFFDCIHPEDKNDFMQHMLFSSSKHFSDNECEYRIIQPNGITRWIWVRTFPIENSEDHSKRIAGIAKDVTERMVSEQKLRESEKRYRMLVQNMGEGVGIVDIYENFTYANNTAIQIFGVSDGILVGKNLKDFCTESSYERVMEETIKRRQGESTSYEIDLLTDNGIRHLILTASPLIDTDGTFLGSLGIFRDLTDILKAEEELIYSQKLLKTTFDAINDMIIIIDKDFNILMSNWKGHEYLSDEDKKAPSKCYKTIMQRDDICNYCSAQLVFRSGETISNEQVNPLDHSIKEVTISPIFDKEGNVEMVIEHVRDITERKLQEKEKKKMEQRLNQSQKLETIGTLAGGIAHDFNNILMPIIGYAELTMMDSDEDSFVHDNLDHILKGAKRAKELVEQILTFSRQNDIETRSILIDDEIVDAVKLLKATIPSTISIRYYNDIPDVRVLANSTQIHQIIMNLSTNAYHAIDVNANGLIEIEVNQATDQDKEKFDDDIDKTLDYVKISISDNGSGMGEETRRRIFEPFFTTKDVGKGTGLGLSVIHGIIKSLEGYINVETEVGKGTTFEIFIPESNRNSSDDKEDRDVLSKGSGNILIVDDEIEITSVLKVALGKLGYRTIISNSSLEALKMFSSEPHKYHLIITDQTMPSMTGLELTKKIREIRDDIPIIMITGFSEQVDSSNYQEAGIDAYLLKPIEPTKLAMIIKNICERY